MFGWTQKDDNKQSMEIIDFGEGEDGWVKFMIVMYILEHGMLLRTATSP